jgi:starvation-inducible DNA-binding protein
MNTNTQIINMLNKALSNVQVEYVKLHNYHWNVQGPHFFNVHNLTEEYYEYFAGQYDEIAERILQLDGTPFSTMRDYLDNATISEDTDVQFTAQPVMQNLLTDFGELQQEFKKISEFAGETGDTTTANLADDNVQWLEKAMWMLSASLK